MSEDWTCGKGLAVHSALPLAMARVLNALAKNLELHLSALDVADERARREYEAYLRLVIQHRMIADQLQAVGDEMASYQTLPMGAHDEQAMLSSEITTIFEAYVNVEQELLSLLGQSVREHRAMLSGEESE